MSYNLLCYDQVVRSDAFLGNITAQAHKWRRSIRALGGYWLGSFTLTPETTGMISMRDFFMHDMGDRVVEETYGIVSWEGEIVQMDLTYRGITYRRTMDSERWHNKVKVTYTDNATGNAAATAWSENTDSSDRYGESCYIDVVSNQYDSTIATALRDRRLTENAFPKPLAVGGLAFSPGAGEIPDRLEVVCAGYAFSMNRRYRESDTAAAAVSTQISTLIGESEFVTAGVVDTNALSVPIEGSEIPFRLWEGLSELIELGDGSGNRWVGGVYAERKFNYKQAETVVTHYWINSQLVDRAHTPMRPSLIKPDIIVQVAESPFGATPAGGNVWDDARNVIIEEVEFAAPNAYRLIAYDTGVLEGTS